MGYRGDSDPITGRGVLYSPEIERKGGMRTNGYALSHHRDSDPVYHQQQNYAWNEARRRAKSAH